MFRKSIATSLILSAMVVVGCKKEDTTAPNTPKSDASATADKAMNDAKNVAKDATANAQSTVNSATTTPPAAAPAATATPAAPAAADTTDAQAKLTEVMNDIKDKKYDLADKALTQLENNKASLPASVAAQLPAARSALTAAQAGGGASGIKLPN